MNKTVLEREAKEAEVGDTLVLQFARQAIGDVHYLLGMHRNGFLEIARRDYLTVLAVVSSHEWGSDFNRTIRVVVGLNFQENLDWFVGRMSRPLETFVLMKQSEQPPQTEQAQPPKVSHPREPKRPHFRVTGEEKSPWHSEGKRPISWSFGQDSDEDSGGLAALFKEKGLM